MQTEQISLNGYTVKIAQDQCPENPFESWGCEPPLPAWVEKVGAPADSIPAQLESACNLHGQWQWGDVYGVASIEDENGAEIPHGSCWGFYGSDHEKSGLLDHARNAIECHERSQEKEAFRLSAALCSLE